MPLSANHHLNLKNGIFDATTAVDLAGLFHTFAAEPELKPLVVHFHGGLNNEQVALETAEQRLLAQYQEAGAYPVFFIWQSGLREVLQHNLAAIFEEKIFQRIRSLVTQFVEAKLRQDAGTRGERLEIRGLREINKELRPTNGTMPLDRLDASQLPPDEKLQSEEEKQFREVLGADLVLEEEAEAIVRALRPEEEVTQERGTRSLTIQGSRHTLMSPDLFEELWQKKKEDPTSSTRSLGLTATGTMIAGAIKVLASVIRRLAQKRDHGIYTTIVEEILREFYLANAGKLIWDTMKNDTKDAFGADPNRYGGTAFLRQLKQQWEANLRPRIILVGHSTGAVYICHFLAEVSQQLPPEVKFEVIFLAPACDFKLWGDTVTLYGERIRSFRQFGMSDALEAVDRLVPVVPIYPRSLLYFVSGVLEDEADKPIVGMERYYSGQPPYDAQAYAEIEIVRRFVDSAPGSLIWSEQDLGSGQASAAKKHGDFDDVDEPTIRSVQHIIREGF